MRVYGAAALADLFGDMLAYRNLCPLDRRVPDGPVLAAQLGLGPARALRKGADDYARIVAEILRRAHALQSTRAPLRRVVVIGDTAATDGATFTSLRSVTPWQGRAFICQEAPANAPASRWDGETCSANRWAAIDDFAAALDAEQFDVDQQTAIVLDIDKTLIGARGRNHQLIDDARLQALRASVAGILGDAYDDEAFAQIYQELNQPGYHAITADNQDYVGYLCVMIASGVIEIEAVRERRHAPAGGFAGLIGAIGARGAWPSAALASFHEQIAGLVAAGDPTPFKAFRYNELRETARRMGCMPDGTPAEALLRTELVITAEVWQVAHAWRARGALLFGLSDKPDEAAIPTPEAAASGARPLHRIVTHIVGDA